MKNRYPQFYKYFVLIFFCFLLTGNICRGQFIHAFAGIDSSTGYSGDGGPATRAHFTEIYSVACDPAGNVYIADRVNNCIRKVNSAGIISTFAGTGTAGYSGDGGYATAAKINLAQGVACDSAGNIYIADTYNYRVRKVDTAGIITTVAGGGSSSGSTGAATAAGLGGPVGVAFDSYGNMYILADVVSKVNTSGSISLFAGGGSSCGGGRYGDGAAASCAFFSDPISIAADDLGNVYISDYGDNRVRKVDTTGIVTTFAGGGTSGTPDGVPATASNFNHPFGVVADRRGNVYISDYADNIVRKVNSSGIIYTYVGDEDGGYWGDGGPARSAALHFPYGLAIDNRNFLFICDFGNKVVRVIDTCTVPYVGAISGPYTVCAGSSITLSDSVSGGTWSISSTIATIDASSGMVVGVSPGTAIVSYAVAGGCGSVTVLDTLTISSTPVAGVISGTAVVCEGRSISLSDSGGMHGTWSSGSTSIATVDTLGIVYGVAGGSAAITYTVANSCGTVAATYSISVTPLPSAGIIAGDSSICHGAADSLVSTGMTSGYWSSSSTSVATVGGSGIAYGCAVGVATISYTVSNACGISTATKTIHVVTAPYPGSISGTTSVCRGSTIDLSDTGSSAAGIWSSSATTVATVDSTGLVSGIAGGVSTISYTAMNACGAASVTKIVTVNTPPNAGTIYGIDSVCAENTVILNTTSIGGHWISSNTSDATVSSSGIVYGLSAGHDTIMYIVTNICGSDTASFTVFILPHSACTSGINPVENLESKLTVTPNPNNGCFMVRVSSAQRELCNLSVSNVLGKCLLKKLIDTNNDEELLMNVPPGIYFLSAVTNNERFVVKIVVK